ncbi:hypothetical protein HGH92_31645 [Chitinophaga varians]|uniref:Uncharacterized protein n=1 Tax=Chitinophaga varians TaxID=2202339 RepID=A0A847S746_9BACT|nr:hypothetical protein [Chitinophaga varians]NLR68898.1 hypothetical protein [Chitinophaga varians]
MKKIQVAFAALAAVAGIGGAYAATHQETERRFAQTYNWYTPSGKLLTAHATIGAAQVAGGCGAPAQITCLRGTHAGLSNFTLFKPL